MPKYGVHHIVLEDARNGDLIEPELGRLLREHNDMANLGAIGPDLFFWGPDYWFVQKLKEIYNGYDAILKAYKAVTLPIDEAIKAAGDAIDMVTPATYAINDLFVQKVEETTKLFSAVVASGALSAALGGLNLLTDAAGIPSVLTGIFDEFKPPRQDNKKEPDWYWFDMLHYRRTGAFARNLIEGARNGSDRQRAYAYGYLSHVATDLTGHPYVNQIVGGPYRLHVQRHAIVENFIDTWAFDHKYGESVNQTLVTRLGLQNLNRLPDEIVELLFGTFAQTYPLVTPHPKYFGPNQILETYDNLRLVLAKMEELAIPYPTEPFADIGKILAEAFNDLFEPPPAPPPVPSQACSWEDIIALGATPDSRSCYNSIFDQFESYFEYLGRLAEWLLDTARDLVDLLSAALASIPLAVAMAILYEMQLTLYDVLQTIRSALALGGLVCPEPGDLNSAHGRNLTTTYQECVIDPGLAETYPVRTTPLVSPVVCPPRRILGRSNFEQPTTVPGFAPPGSEEVTPAHFMYEVPFVDETALTRYAEAKEVDEGGTSALHAEGVQVGNAVKLTQWLINKASDEGECDRLGHVIFANFDLDADRGYFYRTWKGLIYRNRVQVDECPYDE